ncbi:HTH-type transcriptional repressor NanR [Bosea thiooxidans]
MRVRDFSRPTTLNPDRLFGQVAQKLAVAIITGRVKAGELLPNEDDLRSEISVSRTAYREAVKILTAKGLVEARPKSGTRAASRERWNLLDPDVLSWHFEADPNERFIRDLFELRRFVEPSAARLAAQRRTSADIARIEAAYRGMADGAPYAEATIRADMAFHEAIFSAAQNAALQCLASAVIATLQWSLLLKTGDEVAYIEFTARSRARAARHHRPRRRSRLGTNGGARHRQPEHHPRLARHPLRYRDRENHANKAY